MGAITVLLDAAVGGDRKAQEELYEITRHELRKLALHWIRRMGAKEKIRTTEVIDQTFLNLMKLGPRDWQHRGHFYAFAVKNILWVVLGLIPAKETRELTEPVPDPNPGLTAHSLITLHEALQDLERDLSARHRTIIELRFLGECTLDEIAAMLGIKRDRVFQESRVALLFLRKKLKASFPNLDGLPQPSNGA